jgi:hypothetical protein
MRHGLHRERFWKNKERGPVLRPWGKGEEGCGSGGKNASFWHEHTPEKSTPRGRGGGLLVSNRKHITLKAWGGGLRGMRAPATSAHSANISCTNTASFCFPLHWPCQEHNPLTLWRQMCAGLLTAQGNDSNNGFFSRSICTYVHGRFDTQLMIPCRMNTLILLKTKLRGLSPRAKLLRIVGATWSVWRIPTAVFSDF